MKKYLFFLFISCIFVLGSQEKNEKPISYNELFFHSEELKKEFLEFPKETICIKLKKNLFNKYKIKLIITNNSDKNLNFPKLELPDNSVYSLLIVKDSQNNDVEYTGEIGDTFIFSDKDFVLIKPGKSLKRTINICENFNIQKNEIYTIQYNSMGMKDSVQ